MRLNKEIREVKENISTIYSCLIPLLSLLKIIVNIITGEMLVPLVLLALASTASTAYFDLTYPINSKTVYWYKNQFKLTPFVRQTDPFWKASNTISTPEHGGTHIDAPYHFSQDGWKLGEIPFNNLFMVNGIIINKTEEVMTNPEYHLTVKDIEEWEKANGPLPDRCVVFVMFGWGATRYPNRTAYLGLRGEDDWDRHFPSISGEAATWFVDSGKVLGMGTDTASPDCTGDPIVHKILTKHNKFIIENLDLSKVNGVPLKGFKLVILPMKIEEGTGAPVRVVLVNDEKDE